ncbi:DUF5819 family protein [Streptomyces sp. N50]|uniref:DUF5819 family protein n=1 Tax=Streptomyces sp. N50 TaxID=3081765 RepID=UPI002962566C|nr:DUF5819 family protein [Streptomyces sp. N50]WOX11012.1 DUF5819 family protein [Streptomyces sp. N50]
MDANDGGSNAPEESGRKPASDEGPGTPVAPEGPRPPAVPEGPRPPVVPEGPPPPATPEGPRTAAASGWPHVPAQQPPHPPPSEPQPQPQPQPSYGPTVPADAPATAPATVPAYPDARIGVAALSLRYQVGAALAVAVVAVAALVHLGMVFLHVAPSNTVTKQHGKAIDEWIYPEFEQNWKLFAPNPLQQNIEVQVRADVRGADGTTRTTGWYDLSAEDGAAIDGNLLPSHTEQNELRRAWDFLTATHDNANRPIGLRGTLAETYLRRIVVLRLDRDDAAGKGGAVQRVQVRSRTTNVPPPEWSDEQVSTTPQYRLLPWWPVPADEAAGGVR